jgi:NADPH:quinone reductase-like Zn-dependent oxidoreductase
MRRIIFEQFGGPEHLRLIESPMPDAGPDELRVRVLASAINPVELRIYAQGPQAQIYGVRLPSGNGNDYAGVIDQVGTNLSSEFASGDRVFGGVRMRAQADYLVPDLNDMFPLPNGMSFEQAAGIYTSGRAALGSVGSQSIAPGDTILVSAAAGAVGSLAVQVARRLGAVVVGTASERNHAYLRSLGAIPVAYGPGLVERLRLAAPGGFQAVLDYAGSDTIDAAREIGVPAHRINTIAAKTHRIDEGITTVHGSAASRAQVLEFAELLVEKELQLAVSATLPMENYREAYDLLQDSRVPGKIVLTLD